MASWTVTLKAEAKFTLDLKRDCLLKEEKLLEEGRVGGRLFPTQHHGRCSSLEAARAHGKTPPQIMKSQANLSSILCSHQLTS